MYCDQYFRSNCHIDVAKQLRKHYMRPNFLPDNSESSNIDWLFMGGFGGGAGTHVSFLVENEKQLSIDRDKFSVTSVP